MSIAPAARSRTGSRSSSSTCSPTARQRRPRSLCDQRFTSARPRKAGGGRANQLRLWFASFAYVLLEALRRIALRHTQFATATCGTIRLKLLKIGALVRISVRRIKVAMASACPYQAEYRQAYLDLARAAC
jgi:hypothetical protein